MSNQARWHWRSGRLTSSPIQDFWGPTLSARDPQIPNLPLETPAAPGAGFPDSDDSWWSGAQRCFVGVAIAGAAAALTVSVAAANSFKHQDEVPTAAAPTSVGGASFFGQRERVRTKFFSWPQTDELPGVAAPVALDDSGYTPPRRLVYPAVYPQWADEQIFALGAQTALDDSGWAQLKPWPSPVQFHVIWGQDERPTPSTTFVHQDDGPQLFAASYSVSGFIWATDETLPAVNTAYALADDAWLPPAPVRQLPRQLLVVAQDELVSQAPLPPSAGTASFYGQRERSRTKFLYWPTSDELPAGVAPAVALEDTHWTTSTSTAALPRIAQWSDEELAFPFILDDSGWLPPRPPASAVQSIVSFGDDFCFLPSVTALAEDDWLTPVPAFTASAGQLWLYQDEIPAAAVPLAADEDYWLRFPFPPKPAVTSLSQYLPVDEDFPELTAPPTPPTTFAGQGNLGWEDRRWKTRRELKRRIREELQELLDPTPAVEYVATPYPDLVPGIIAVLEALEPPQQMISRISDTVHLAVKAHQAEAHRRRIEQDDADFFFLTGG